MNVLYAHNLNLEGPCRPLNICNHIRIIQNLTNLTLLGSPSTQLVSLLPHVFPGALRKCTVSEKLPLHHLGYEKITRKERGILVTFGGSQQGELYATSLAYQGQGFQ